MTELDKFRTLPEFEGLSDADIITRVSARIGERPEAIAAELGVKISAPGFGTGFATGLSMYPVGAGRMLEDVGAPGVGGALRRYGEDVQFRNPTTVHDFESFGASPWQGTKEIIGQGLGSTLPTLIPYVGPVGRAMGATGATVAGTGLAAVPSYGGIRRTQEETGQRDLMAAAAGALTVGAVEQVGGVQRLMRPRAPGQVIAGATQFERGQFAGTPLRTMGRQTLVTGLQEGAEELVQGPIEQYAGGQDPREHLGETAFGGFSGLVAGAVPFGLASGVRRGLQHSRANQFMNQNLGNQDAPTTDQLGAVQLARENIIREHGRPDLADSYYEQQVGDIMRAGIARGLQTGQSYDILKGGTTEIMRTVEDQLATGGFADPALTPGTPRVIDYNQQGQPYVPNQALTELGQDVYQALPHTAGGTMPMGMSVEEQVSRAAGIISAAAAPTGGRFSPSAETPYAPGDMSGQMQQDVQWAQQVLQQHLGPQGYQDFVKSLPEMRKVAPKTSTRPVAAVQAKLPQQPKPAPKQPEFVQMYRETAKYYSPVQKALAEVQTKEQAVEIVRNWLENKSLSQDSTRALEEMHKKLTGQTMTEYMREKEKSEALKQQPQGAPDASGQVVLPGPAQKKAGARPVQKVQAQVPAESAGTGGQATQVPRAEEVENAMQFVLGELARRDPTKAAILDRHLRGETDPQIAAKTGLSKARVQQLRKEAAAIVEGIARSKGLRPEQFRDEETESASTLAGEQEETVMEELAPIEKEEVSDEPVANVTAEKVEGSERERTIADIAPSQQTEGGEKNTGFRIIQDARDINSDKSSDQDDARAKALAGGFEKARKEGDLEGEAKTHWDGYVHALEAQGQKEKTWDELSKTAQGQKTQKDMTELLAWSKTQKKPDAAMARKILQKLKEAYYTRGQRTVVKTDRGDIQVDGLDPASVPAFRTALLRRTAEGFGPLILSRLSGVYIVKGLRDDFDAAVVWQDDDGKYVMVINPETFIREHDQVYVERVFQHEVEHLIDDASRFNGLYSAHPVFQKDGPIDRELMNRWRRGNPWVRQTFGFPLDPAYGPRFTDPQDFPKELYAQVMSAYHVPELHGRFAAELPLSFRFAESLYAAQKDAIVGGVRLQTVRARESSARTTPAREGREAAGSVATRQDPAREGYRLRPTADGFENDEVALTAGREVAVIDGSPAMEYVVKFPGSDNLGVATVGFLDGKPSILYFVASGRKYEGWGEKIMRALVASAHEGELLINDTLPGAVGFYEKLGAQWITTEKNYGNATITWEQLQAARSGQQKPAPADAEQRGEATEGGARQSARRPVQEEDPYEHIDDDYLRLQERAEKEAAGIGMGVDEFWRHIWDGNFDRLGPAAGVAREMASLQQAYWRDFERVDAEQTGNDPYDADGRFVYGDHIYFKVGAKVNQDNYPGQPAEIVKVEERRDKPTLYTLRIDVRGHPEGVDDNGERVDFKEAVVSDKRLIALNPVKTSARFSRGGALTGKHFLNDEEFFYHAVFDDKDIDSIVANGLRAGTNVSRSDGQAFEDEGGTVLVFRRADYRLRKKGYQDDELVTYGAGKPVAIFKDTTYDTNKALEGAELDAEYKKLADEYDAIDAKFAAMAEEMGVTLESLKERVITALVTKDFTPFGDYAKSAREWARRQDAIGDQVMRIEDRNERGNISRQDVLDRYKKYGLPVFHARGETDEQTGSTRVHFSRGLIDTSSVIDVWMTEMGGPDRSKWTEKTRKDAADWGAVQMRRTSSPEMKEKYAAAIKELRGEVTPKRGGANFSRGLVDRQFAGIYEPLSDADLRSAISEQERLVEQQRLAVLEFETLLTDEVSVADDPMFWARDRLRAMEKEWRRRHGASSGGGRKPPTVFHSFGLVDRDPPDDRFSAARERASTTIADAWAKYKPTLLTLQQLVDQFGGKLASLKDYTASMDKMEQRQQTLMNRAHNVLTKWQALHGQTRNALNALMLEATTRGIHPDEAFGPGTPNDHLTDQDEYNALKRRFDALPAESKAIYKDVRKLLEDNWQARKEAFSRAVTSAYKKLIDDAQAAGNTANVAELTKERDKSIKEHARHIATIKGPYFPLMRFGDYLTIAESKELKALRERNEQTPSAELRKEIERLKKDGKHYVVTARENRYKADVEAAKLRTQGFEVHTQLAEEHFRQLQPVSAAAVDRIGERISSQFDRETAAKMKNIVTQLYISTLPEHAALQRQLRRQGIEGATSDMLRAVAQAVEKDAFHLARMEFADEITSNLFKLKQESKRDVDLGHVYRDLAARQAMDFDWHPAPIQTLLARMSGIWHLGMSPAYLFTNSTQPWLITAPVLAGKFGLGKSLDAMRAAWTDAVRIIVQSKKDGAFADINFEGVSDPGEKAALKAVMDRGQIDITQNVDMGLIADGVDPKFLKMQKAFNWTNHHIEASNRVVTALAAYRLARGSGMTQEQAQDYAFKQVVDTQLNYTNANAAYWMKHGAVPLGRLIFQFRKYQQGMLYLLARNAQLAFQGDKDAQRALAYLAATQLAVAGAVGIPVVTAPLAALGMFIGGGDDEKGDLETQLRNYLADLMGPEAARVFWKGLPTMFGVDVSKRLGMGDMWKPMPFLRLTGRTGSEDMSQLVAQSLGAPFGMLGRIWDGAYFHWWKKGDWLRGVEAGLPKMLADPLKAGRYATKGITTRADTTVLRPEKFDAWDIAFKAAGFSPSTESEHYAAVGAKEETARAIDEKRKAVLATYANAFMRGGDVKGAMEKIEAFNKEHPSKGYRIDRSTMIRAVQTRRKGAKDLDEAGVRFPKNQRSLQGIDRFAYGT